MQLRPYQLTAVDEIRNKIARGVKKILVHAPTGTGKTVIFCYVMTNAEKKERRSMMVVRGRKLVSQASNKLLSEHVSHGVMMANHWLLRPHAPIQICSIDTMVSRGLVPPADIIIVDEAHLATSDGFREFLLQYPNAVIIAVTATPYPGKSMRHLADEVVRPITMREAIAQGFLVGGRYFRPFAPDVSGVKVSRSTGDYDQGQLGHLMDKAALIGDIVEQWKKHGESRPTIAFAASVRHSTHIAESFNAAGISAQHIDADTPEAMREEAIRRLKNGTLKVLSNVGILGTGVDIPEAGCGIMARPTKSYCLWVQQCGRFTRPFPGKHDFIILDHSDNLSRHGFPEDDPEAELDGKEPRAKRDVAICDECFAAFRGTKCPACNAVKASNGGAGESREIVSVPGELKEVDPLAMAQETKALAEELSKRARHRDSLFEQANACGYKPGWVFHKLKDAYGEGAAAQLMRFHWRKT